MAQSQFLEDFEQKMGRLAEIRRQLQASVQFKQTFTDELKTKLGEINGKVSQLSGLINELKTRADNLEKQVGTNTASISDRERQIGEINQQIANANAEKDRVTQEFNQHREATQREIDTRQNRIDEMEGQLRQLTEQLRVATEQKEAAEAKANSLQTELTNQGDQQAVHAQQIEALTKQNQERLKEQQEGLKARIAEGDAANIALHDQLQEKTREHEQALQQLNERQGLAEGQVAELQRQIQDLTQENQQLIDRIKAATEAINEANDELAAIVDSVPNAQTKQEVDALLNEITQQLEQSIQNISRAAQGQPAAQVVATPAPVNQSQPKLFQPNNIPANTPVQVNDTNTMLYGVLLNELFIKSKQLARNNPTAKNKYKEAAQELQNVVNPNEIRNILKKNSIEVKNNKISGGRKTRKNRKQKGGFTYKVGVKRRNIKSKSSRRSSRRSSR